MGPLSYTLLLLAVWWDVKTHRIPNQLVLLGLLLASATVNCIKCGNRYSKAL